MSLRLGVLCLLLSQILAASPARAIGCWSFFAKASAREETTASRAVGDPAAKVDARVQGVTLGNYYSLGRPWLAEVVERLKSLGQSNLAAKLAGREELLTNGFFRHAFQNTVQHGSESITRGVYEFTVDVTTSVHVADQVVVFQWTNPQIKPFPAALEGRFFAGAEVDVPPAQRVGFRGLGMAHWEMISDLKSLPSGSYVEWSSSGSAVTFTLAVDFRSERHP